jgi:uncharacterized membrane protein
MLMPFGKQRHGLDAGRSGGRDHPIVGWVGLLAIVITILLLVWARVAVIGTRDIEEALVAPAPQADTAQGVHKERGARGREVDEAVTSSRWATGFSP